MAAEDAVVDAVTTVAMKIVIDGIPFAFKIFGKGAKVTGVILYTLAQKINNKEKNGKPLTPGENNWKKLVKSGDEIHTVWINRSDLVNFTQIAKQFRIGFVATKNGDAIEKSRNFLLNKNNNDELINFTDNYKDMVSIQYRASDEIRMSHILEMFDTFNKTKTTAAETVSPEKDTTVDEVEKFMKENGVKFEYPPEVVAYEEVSTEKTQKNQASEKSSTITEKEVNSKTQEDFGKKTSLCFEQFGFDKMPTKNEYNAAYINYIKENKINTSEPNFITALYEQGCKLIEGVIKMEPLVQTTVPKNAALNKPNIKSAKTEVAECFKFFGFNKTPSVQELKSAYTNFIKNKGKTNGSNIVDNMYNAAVDLLDKPNKEGLRFCYEFFGFDKTPTKAELENAYKNYVEKSTDVPSIAKSVYENALNFMQKSESVRQTLQAKQELHRLHQSDNTTAKDINKHIDNSEKILLNRSIEI